MTNVRAATLLACTGTMMAAIPPAARLSGIPGYFLKTSAGYMAQVAGVQMELGSSKVHMRSAAGQVEIRFPGSNPRAAIEAAESSTGTRVNLFHGNASQWATDLPTFSSVRYRELYPGIDLVYRASGPRLKSESW